MIFFLQKLHGVCVLSFLLLVDVTSIYLGLCTCHQLNSREPNADRLTYIMYAFLCGVMWATMPRKNAARVASLDVFQPQSNSHRISVHLFHFFFF